MMPIDSLVISKNTTSNDFFQKSIFKAAREQAADFALLSLILLYFVLICFILLYFALFCFILFDFALFCLILLYFI